MDRLSEYRKCHFINRKRLLLTLLSVTLLGGCGGGTVWRSDGETAGSDRTPVDTRPTERGSTTGADTTIITDGSSQAIYDPNTPSSLEPDVYLLRAERANSPERESLQLDAVSSMLDREAFDNAIATLAGVDVATLPPDLQLRHAIATARIEAERIGPEQAIANLQSVRSSPRATPAIAAEALLALAQAQATANLPMDAANALLDRSQILQLDTSSTLLDKERNDRALWNYLSGPDIVTLRRARNAATTADASAWYELAEIHRLYENQPGQRDQAIASWRSRNSTHPANIVLASTSPYGGVTVVDGGANAYVEPSDRIPSQIALLLPMNSRFGKQANAVYDGFISMHEQDSSARRANVILYDIGQDASLIASFYQQAVSEGADFIVGPLGRTATRALIESGVIELPTLLLGSSDSLTGLSGAVYQFGLLPEAEARMVAERAFEDGHRSALILAPSSEWGARLKGALSETWVRNGGTVLAEANYTPGEAREYGNVIKHLLNITDSEARRRRISKALGHSVEFQPRRRQDVDVVLMAARSKDGRLLKPQINFHQGHDLPVYSTSHIYSARPNALSDADLDGIVFPEMPWIVSADPSINNLKQRLSRAGASANSPIARLFAFGMDAYGLVPVLNKLRTNPRARFGGVTALLGLDESNSVTRSPVWTRFDGGSAVPMENATTANDPGSRTRPSAATEN